MDRSIDVVIPVYDHYTLTRECLRRLSLQTVPHRVIVVDDGSSDGTPSLVRNEWPKVTVLELATNHGYTKAVNHGVAAGDGTYVILLNNDVCVRPDFLERIVAPMHTDQTLGSVASLMVRQDEVTIDSFGVTADPTLAGFARLRGRPVGHARSSGLPVLTGPEGTAGAYRRSAWEQVGGLDETIVAYMEILDLALRLRTAGWGTIGVPDAVGVHLGSATYGRRSSRQRRLAGFSRAYLLRRYNVFHSRVALRTILTEALVVATDAASCRDTHALRGRIEGWRAARGRKPHKQPPQDAIDESISFWRSMVLRRGAIASTPTTKPPDPKHRV